MNERRETIRAVKQEVASIEQAEDKLMNEVFDTVEQS